ncbi:hypothetical protein EII29_08050 [Leptotrichia sp. OH3620_COT-345]|uniref:hypothetical protein n=1 Tax=Leptotrichia sp. OH3620_COT-345 TaxID=2491048 RepID=UPI000F646511|nr:hypothetical protein [Leptotrichia sp. OH3620_COT-345]RRD39185.1 hypothetical protein EII29_08050 [Leptotrichia sp. OH3620_COT-345]
MEENGSIDGDKHYFYISRSRDFELTKSEAEEKLKKDVGEELRNVEMVYNNPAGYVYQKNGEIGYL